MRIACSSSSGNALRSLRLPVLLGFGAVLLPLSSAPSSEPEEKDPFVWLEDIKGDRAVAWVLGLTESIHRELQAFPAYHPDSACRKMREEMDYPRPFILTTTREDRVHPGHARKVAARMMSYRHDVLDPENVAGGHAPG